MSKQHKTRPEVIKKFMLNTAEHEILNAHQYKNIEKCRFFQAQISLECFFPAHKNFIFWGAWSDSCSGFTPLSFSHIKVSWNS